MAAVFPSPRQMEKAGKTGKIPRPITTGALTAFIGLIVYEASALNMIFSSRPGLDFVSFASVMVVVPLLLFTFGNCVAMYYFAEWRYGGTSGIRRYAAGTLIGTSLIIGLGILLLAGAWALLGSCIGVC